MKKIVLTDREERREKIESADIQIISYRLGNQFHCVVNDLGRNITLAETNGSSRMEAESTAVSMTRKILTSAEGVSRWEDEGGSACV